MARVRLPVLLAVSLSTAALGCTPRDDAPPADRPVWPTGLALVPGGAHLLVVSSNFDLTYRRGAVLSVDIAAVDAAIGDGDGSQVVADPFVSAVEVPSFGDRPAVTSGGERAFLAARGENLLVELAIDADGALSCVVGEPPEGEPPHPAGIPTCGRNPSALLFPGADPFHVAVTGEARDDDGALVAVDGVATALSSPDIVFWHADLGRTDAERLQVPRGNILRIGEDVGGLRGLAILPRPGLPTLALVAAERARDSARGRGTDLVLLEARPNAPLTTLDLSEAAGSLFAREIVVVPSIDPATPPSSVLVALRSPDAIARVDVTTFPGGAAQARIGGVQATCDDPSKISTVRLDPDGAPDTGDEVVRALVACYGDDAILSYDVDTLSVADALRFFGRGPYDVVVDPDHVPPRAYVSFFSEGTVGVIDLVVDGAPALQPRGKIGEPLPAPETGRE